MVTSQAGFGYHWLGGCRKVLGILCGLRDRLLCTKTSLAPKTSSQHHMEKSSTLIWFQRATEAMVWRDPGGVLQAGNGQQCCLTASHPCFSPKRGALLSSLNPQLGGWLIPHPSRASIQPCSVRRKLMYPPGSRRSLSMVVLGINICPPCRND